MMRQHEMPLPSWKCFLSEPQSSKLLLNVTSNIFVYLQIDDSVMFIWFCYCSRVFIWQTCNALFIIRVVLTHWIRIEKESALVKRFVVHSSENGGPESLLENLAVQLVEILVDIPLRSDLYSCFRPYMNLRKVNYFSFFTERRLLCFIENACRLSCSYCIWLLHPTLVITNPFFWGSLFFH